MKNISQEEIRSLTLPFPSVPEQRAIADFLDSVDESMRAMERLILKLEQQRYAIVHALLDRLSDIREPGSSSTAAAEFDIKAGITLGPHRSPRRNARPYLRVANVQRGYLDLADVATLEVSRAELLSYSIRPGDLLVVEGHANPNEIGRCTLVRRDLGVMTFQNHLFRLRCRRMNPEFAYLWLNSHHAKRYWRQMCATSSGLYTINSRQLTALPVWAPDQATQDRIVKAARALDRRLDSERGGLAKLRMLRQGLMEDLLTGRVRLHGAEDVVV